MAAECLAFNSQAPPWEWGQRATAQRRSESSKERGFLLSRITHVHCTLPPITLSNAMPPKLVIIVQWSIETTDARAQGTEGRNHKKELETMKISQKTAPPMPCTQNEIRFLLEEYLLVKLMQTPRGIHMQSSQAVVVSFSHSIRTHASFLKGQHVCFGDTESWFQFLWLSLTSCVYLGKWLNMLKLQFFISKVR